MKSPRELLLSKHRQASSKLDEIRREVVEQTELGRARHSVRAERRAEDCPPYLNGWHAWRDLLERLFVRGWQELFVSSLRVWLGLAAVWAVILALNLTSSETAVQTARGPAPKAEEVIASLQENTQRIMAELGVASLKPEIAEPREPDPVIRPRSERVQPVAMA